MAKEQKNQANDAAVIQTQTPVDVSPQADARGGPPAEIRAVASPVINTADGVVEVIQPPIVINSAKKLDPNNPTGVEVLPAPKSRNADRQKLIDELNAFHAMGYDDPRYDADRAFELHYLIAGKPVPEV